MTVRWTEAVREEVLKRWNGYGMKRSFSEFVLTRKLGGTNYATPVQKRIESSRGSKNDRTESSDDDSMGGGEALTWFIGRESPQLGFVLTRKPDGPSYVMPVQEGRKPDRWLSGKRKKRGNDSG
jgi:hypothetical protein